MASSFSSRSARRRSALAGGVAAVAAVVLAALAVGADASSTPTLTVATSVKIAGAGRGSIAADGAGLAVYELLPETTAHPLCTSSTCLGAWFPVKVKSGAKPSKSSGVSGTLGTWKRDGFTQVTLNGHPLYTFVGDSGKRGVANGNGLRSFGGTWHVITEGGAAHAVPGAGSATGW